ncbi:hypothetical protein A244_10890, partial [Pseudomonas syringae pv. actinidiae ICMP 18807]
EIEQILPVLLQLVKEVAMILGGSVAVGAIAGGVAGSIFFGVGAVPVAAVGAGIGLQVGNLILLALGLSSIAEYFYQGLPACLSTLQEGFATAWHADEGLKPEGLDPTGGSAYVMQERIDRAARQLAKGQEQLVLLLFTAIVTYVTRGQVKAGLMGSMDSIAARSAKLQAEISNKQFANWLARNERRLLAEPELRVDEPAPLNKASEEPAPNIEKQNADYHPEEPPPSKFEEKILDSPSSLPGKIVGEYDMISNPGPLADLEGNPAANFSGGKYRAIELSEDVILYRGGDINGKALGRWFTLDAPTSVAQVRIDTAVKPQWIDPATNVLTGTSPVNAVYTVKIPAGTVVYEGAVGNQGGLYMGGADIKQIFVQDPWMIPGVEVIGHPVLIK